MADKDIIWMRSIVFCAALFGAIGVAAAAGASHNGSARNLGAISTICLAHGPALLAMALAIARLRTIRWAAALLVGGTVIFVGDLACREWLSQPVFAGAAPLGGGAMVLGWLAAALSALLPHKASN